MRIYCPVHKENTPSMVIYESGGKCFGCGAWVPIEKLLDDRLIAEAPKNDAIRDNLEDDLLYIRSLPIAHIRGLSLPVDNQFYYVVWPGQHYFKRRKILDEPGSKYLCPKGHHKPLFVAREYTRNSVLAIVEGELNALSLAAIQPEFSVCSPGGAADFFGKNYDAYRKYYLKYKQYIVIVDKDAAGVQAAVKIRERLLQHTPYIDVWLMEKDCNDLLVNGRLKEEVGMRARMRPGGLYETGQLLPSFRAANRA